MNGSRFRLLLRIAALCLGIVLIVALIVNLNTSKPTGPVVDYDTLLTQGDAELVGPITVTEGTPKTDDYVYRMTTFGPDGVTPKVSKDLLVAQYYGPPTKDLAIPVRYNYYRADGTLEKTKRVEPYNVFGASCQHKVVETQYDATGTKAVKSRYLRENGQLAALFDESQGDVWKHFRTDDTLAHVQICDDNGYTYTHYRKNGNVWWTFKHLSKQEIDEGFVHFDWQGNKLERKFQRQRLFKGNGYSGSDMPLDIYADTYFSSDGKEIEYKQTWTAFIAGQESYDGLRLLQIVKNGKLVRQIEYALQPNHLAVVPVSELVFRADGSFVHRFHVEGAQADFVFPADGSAKLAQPYMSVKEGFDPIPAYMTQGFNHNLGGFYDEGENDI